MSRVGGAPPFKNYFIGWNCPARKRTPSPSLSALCLKARVSLKLGATPKELAALTSGRVWTLNQQLVKSLKKQQKDIPRVTSRNDARDSFKPHTASFQLKSKYQTKSLKWLNRVVFISKVKTLEFSSLWSTRVKSCGNSKTVLYFYSFSIVTIHCLCVCILFYVV